MNKIAYICDRKRHCSGYSYCGKQCHHTFDEFHTVNGIIHDREELNSSRFKVVLVANEDIYYEEKTRKTNNLNKG